MFSFLKKEEFGGYVKELKLSKFWKNIDDNDKQEAKILFAKSFYPEPFDTRFIDEKGLSVVTEMSGFEFVKTIGKRAYNQKNYKMANRFLKKSLELAKTPDTQHEALNLLIESTYKLRDEDANAVTECIQYCLQDIKLVAKLSNKDDIISFKRLCIIYENQKDYKKGIEVAKKAIEFGIGDGTKGGFEARIEKMKSL